MMMMIHRTLLKASENMAKELADESNYAALL